jgi:hypothetical protein
MRSKQEANDCNAPNSLFLLLFDFVTADFGDTARADCFVFVVTTFSLNTAFFAVSRTAEYKTDMYIQGSMAYVLSLDGSRAPTGCLHLSLSLRFSLPPP